jgi:hypothetical protein
MPAVQTQLLAEVADLALLGPLASALGPLSTEAKESNLRRASGTVLSAYAKRMTLPLVQWGDFTKGLVVDIAAFYMLTTGPRGLNPSSPDGKLFTENYQRAMETLNAISDLTNKSARWDPDAIDSTEGEDEMGPLAAFEGGERNEADAWTHRSSVGSCGGCR